MASKHKDKYLLNLEHACRLISEVTKEPRKYVVGHIGEAGGCGRARLYDRFGKLMEWHKGVFIVVEPEGMTRIEFSPYYFVDLGEVMDGIGMHPAIQDEVIARHERNIQQSSDALGKPEALEKSAAESKKRYRRIGWISRPEFEYVVDIFKNAQPRPTAKALHKVLLSDAGSNPQSPFTSRLQELIFKDSGKVLTTKTLGNTMIKIREESQKIIP